MIKKIFGLFKRRKSEYFDYEEYDEYDDYYDDDSEYTRVNDKEEEKPAGKKLRLEEFEQARDLNLPVRRKVDYDDKSERLLFIRDNCEQIILAQKNIDEIRDEYALVTKYVSDVQRIRKLPEDKLEDLRAKVDKILNLEEEKDIFRESRQHRISEERYEQMDSMADIVAKDIIKLEEYEDYQRIVEDDLRKLEGERGSLQYEKKRVVASQELLKFIMTTLLMGVVIMVCLFLCLNKLFNKDVMVPFLIISFLAAAICVYVTVQSRRNAVLLKENAVKMNRLIELFNKTKIKCANGINIIEYMYDKYDIYSSMELKQYWGEYQQRRNAENEYRRTVALKNSFCKNIIADLEKYGVSDAQVWLHQLDAIVDDTQMDKISERLEVRRQKLQRTIEYNSKLKDAGFEGIKDVISKNSEYKIEVVAILKRYGVTL